MTGKQVRFFLADGTAGGLMTAEIMNWTGHLIKAKRTELRQLRHRGEAARTGVYLLLGTDEVDNRVSYIGQSDNVADRLMQHDVSKDFWDEAIVITSKDSNPTSAHVRYVGSQLVRMADAVGRYRLLSGNVLTGGADLPEADASDKSYFIEQVRILLSVLGHHIIRGRIGQDESSDTRARPGSEQDSTAVTDSPRFHLRMKIGIDAVGQVVDGEFIVLEGSLVSGRMRTGRGSGESTQKQF